MWKYAKFLLGIMLLLIGSVGIFQLATGNFEKQLQDTRQRLHDNAVATTGVVTGRYVITTAARIGRIGGVGQAYEIRFSFPTRDGKRYGGSVDVTKEQATSIDDGAPIRIKYDSNNPGMHSAIDFENDHSDTLGRSDKPWGAVIAAMLSFLLGGGWLTWRNGARIRQDFGDRTQVDVTRKTRLPMQESRAGLAGLRTGRGGGFGRRGTA